jgi:proteasome accessory factor B
VHHQLPALHAAVRDRAEVVFGYRGRERRLQPFGLLARDGHWYVVGHDVEAASLRAYRLDRFDTPEVRVGEPGGFSRPEGFRAAEAFPADARLVGDIGDGARRARVLIDAGRASVVVAQRSGGDLIERRLDGSVVVEVPCVNRAAFRSWLFDLGEEAEVLEPDDVRDEMIGWLRALAERGTS